MSKKDNYLSKRQLKAITTHGNRHSSTVTGSSLAGIVPLLPSISGKKSKHKKHDKDDKTKESEFVENMTISIDLDVKNISHSDGFVQILSSSIGIVKVKKNFEVLSTAEKIIRAFSKAKFKNVATIELDGEELYHNPKNFYDADKAIKTLIEEIHNRKQPGNKIQMELLSLDHKDCSVDVKVSSAHLPWIHDILIKFHGTLPDEYFRRIINYLEDHLDIENIEKEWRNA